jgi:diguanylate cyclase (GGDEF)-like protein
LRRLTLAGWIVAGYGLLAAVHVIADDATAVSAAARLLAPLGALIASVAALRSLPPSAGGPWILLGVSALAATAGHLLQFVRGGEDGALFPAAAIVHLPFAAGLAWAVHQRDRARQAEITLDTMLVIGAVSLMLIRWAPGVERLLEARGGVSGASALDVVVAPVAAASAVAFGLVLLTALRSSRAGDSAAAIAGAAILLALSAAPAALGIEGELADPYRLAGLAGWGFLAYVGARVVGGGIELFIPADADPGGARLRQTVAPLVALLLAIVVMDAGRGEPLDEATAVTVALMSAGLALRVSRLLDATRDRQSEQRQLAQSQALVEVSNALAGATDLTDTLGRVADWSCRLLDARGAVIELLTDNDSALQVRAAAGFPDDFVGMRFPIEGTFTGWVVRNGVPRTTLDTAAEPDIQAQSRRFLPRSPAASAPMRYHERMLGVLTCFAGTPFDRHDLELLGALADQAAIAIENARLFQQVNHLSMTDPLTGLANRRRLEDELQREFSAAVRGRRLVAVMFDLDEFKEYNDRYGHLAGDEALKLFGAALAAETRSMNLAARYGGDEFVTLLGDTGVDGARIFAQRVKRRFTRGIARLGRRPIGVSIGIAEYMAGMSVPDLLIDAADRELYEVKASRTRAS